MKYIPAEKLKAAIERRKGYISVTHFAEELLSLIDSHQQEQPEAIGGVVHHALGTSWIVTNQKQLGARLKQFPEGTEVEIFIEARKEENK